MAIEAHWSARKQIFFLPQWSGAASVWMWRRDYLDISKAGNLELGISKARTKGWENRKNFQPRSCRDGRCAWLARVEREAWSLLIIGDDAV